MTAPPEKRNAPPRRRPPFGAQIAKILRDPGRLAGFSGCTQSRATIWLVTGPEAWDWQRDRPGHLAVVMPDGEHPAGFRWAFLRGHDPVLLIGPAAEDREQRREIAAAMFRDGVKKILARTILMVAPGEQVAA